MLALVLKALAPVFFVVGALHLLMGPNAEVLLGADLPAAVIADPVLDSQNRFYGVCFAIYGVLLYLSSTDLDLYGSALKAALWVFFAGGLARIVSIVMTGMPSVLVLGLMAVEIILPPVFLAWLAKHERALAAGKLT